MVLVDSPGDAPVDRRVDRKRRWGHNHATRDEFASIWGAGQFSGFKASKHAFFWDSGCMYKQCTECGWFKEATTDNWTCHGVAGGFAAWLATKPWSFRRLCNACEAARQRVKDNDLVGDGYIRSKMLSYPQITLGEGKRGIEWFREGMKGPCYATGLTCWVLKKGHPFCPSPNGMVLCHDANYSTRANHEPEQTVLVLEFINVQQKHTGIGDLRETMVDIFRRCVSDWLQAPAERAAAEEEAMAPLWQSKAPAWVNRMAQNAQHYDGYKRRIKGKPERANDMTAHALAKRLIELRMRCQTTGLLMALSSKGPTRAHADRIDNSDGHVLSTNVELKCAIFINQTRVRRKHWLHVLLHQPLVELPEGMRGELREEYDGLPGCFSDL
jgi:hypothetical protein